MPPKMTANPARPARYRAGKPTGVGLESSSESESEAEETTAAKANPKAPAPPVAKRVGAGQIITSGTLAEVLRQTKRDEDEKRKAREAMECKATEEGFVTESEEEKSGSDEDEDEDEDDEDDEGSSSEDDLPTRKIVLPKFMTRAQRERAAAAAGEKGAGKADEEEKDKDEEEEEEAKLERERQAELDALVEEQLRKQAANKVVSKKQWEDTNEAAAAAAAAAAASSDEEIQGDVNTDDDVDPEAEYAAWKLRELKRIKRQREQIEERERQLAEVERRRNLTEEERRAEDEVLQAKQREEKESRGKAGFMQKYYHKGAFYQEESREAGLDKRDLMGAHYVDEIRNRELLPKAMQIRDMTKLGRKGASKYRDLRAEDTGRWGVLDDNRDRNRTGGWDRDRDWNRDRPDYGGSERDAKGANALPLGERRRHGDKWRSGSQSPRREEHEERRKRSPSQGGRSQQGDKRRRVEVD